MGGSTAKQSAGEDAMQTNEELKAQIQRELPGLLRADPALRDFVLDLTRNIYADRAQTESRFDRVLDELRRDREDAARRWAEEKAENERRWAEEKAENERKWAENKRRWDANGRRWDEEQAESKRLWRESNARFERVHEEIMAQAKKHDRAVGALGARWGLMSERAFRDGLAGILEESFNVEVLRIEDYDDTGEVFGRPEQIELDVIIKNGLLLICELKSSVGKADMYSFERKARFYERRHDRKADRLIVISPMIDPRAAKVAETLGIETYGDSTEVEHI
jgi:hypothetical protein